MNILRKKLKVFALFCVVSSLDVDRNLFRFRGVSIEVSCIFVLFSTLINAAFISEGG